MTAQFSCSLSRHNLILPDAGLGTTTTGFSQVAGPSTFYIILSDRIWSTSFMRLFVWRGEKFSLLVSDLDE